MGALIGACLLAVGGAIVASEVYGSFEGAAAMSGGTLGAFLGAVLGLVLALWAILRRGGAAAGKATAILTGGALVVVACFGFIAFS